MKKILYISDVNDNESIYHSQVVPHVTELRKYHEVHLIVLSRSSEASSIKSNFYQYISRPGDYFYPIAVSNFFLQKKRVSRFVSNKNIDLIYSRGSRGGLLGVLIKRHILYEDVLLLNDVRADVMDEHKRNIIKKNIFNHTNRIVYSEVDLLFLVSNYLKNKVCNTYHFDKNKAFVFPTFVPSGKFEFNQQNRIEIREKLGFKLDDIVIIYSGNFASWQNIDTILYAFSRTRNHKIKMLILTKETNAIERTSKYQIDKERIRLVNSSYDEIHRYYHAGDFGILIRDNTDTNKASAPTKFSEYVNSGLRLIINSIEADYVETFKSNQLSGHLLQKKEDLLDCFDKIDLNYIEKNKLTINTLNKIVMQQTSIIGSVIPFNRGKVLKHKSDI